MNAKRKDMTNDILLDSGKYIQWIDIDRTDSQNIFAIDHLLEPALNFLENLETECAAGCCGIDAFSFECATIYNAAIGLNKNILITTFEVARKEVNATNKQVVTSEIMNNLFDKSVFVQLLDHLITILKSSG